MTHGPVRSNVSQPRLAVGVLLWFALAPRAAFGQLRFEAVSNALTAAPFGASGSAWIDVDGDGFTDVAIAARDSMPNRVFRHRRGTFEPVHLPDALKNANAAAWGDIDGDGDPDLALALQDGIGLYEARAGEDGFQLIPFTASGVIASDRRPRGSHDAVALGDLDGDGDLDLVGAAHGTGGVQVLVNDGSGAFTALPRDQFPFAAWFGGAHIADLDADGRPDLLFSGAPMPLFRVGTVVYWNDGQAWTADRATAFAEHAGGLGSSVADVDQDGDPDVFVAGWGEDTPSALYLNEGRRAFRRSPIPFPPRVVGSSFADFDGDGRLDLVTSSGYGDVGRIELWLGDGGGGFTSRSVPGLTDVAGRYSGLAVVDYDRDGRPDLHVNSKAEPSRLFRNVGEPIGSWVQVELRGRPGGTPVAGARVDFEIQSAASTRRSSLTLHQQSGFGGHGEPVAHLALPSGARVRTVSVSWPGGVLTRIQDPALGARVVVEAPIAPRGAERLPSIELPAELERVLRDYERAWAAGDERALSDLFTQDGFASSRFGWVRGRERIASQYSRAGGELRLRALSHHTAGDVGYIVGAYGYGEAATDRDRGRFVLALRRNEGGRWLIAADLDHQNDGPAGTNR